MGESKLNINSPFKVTVRTATAIFRGGCVSTSRVLFIDRRLYVNSDHPCSLQWWAVQFKLKWPIVFSSPLGRKHWRKNNYCFSSSICILVYIHSLTSVPFLLAHHSLTPIFLSASVRCFLLEDIFGIQVPTALLGLSATRLCSLYIEHIHTAAFFSLATLLPLTML